MTLLPFLMGTVAAAPLCPDDLPASPPATPGTASFALDLWLDGHAPDPAEFARTLLAADRYPLTAQIPWPVNRPALVENRVLCVDADQKGVVILGVTGSKWPVSARQYTVHFRLDQQDEAGATMSWQVIPHVGSAGAWSGPFATALNAYPQAVFTPHNSGRWIYRRGQSWVRYEVAVDPDGWIPRLVNSHESVALVPLEMLRVLFGITGTYARPAP